RGAQSAMLKIDAVLPEELRGRAERSRVFVPQRWYEAKSGVVDALHEAIESRRVLKLEYRDADGTTSTREVEPLCLACWGPVWTLGAWCRMRRDFRNFRPDRMQFVATGEIFAETPARGLDAYLSTMGVRRQQFE
ncbi:MAG: WYL domain-containing protein, partial [Xanthomonadaceae bacterium]|nr:WYL domain-containing protein [Xanthomonadaceae bacterium]